MPCSHPANSEIKALSKIEILAKNDTFSAVMSILGAIEQLLRAQRKAETPSYCCAGEQDLLYR